MRLVIDGERCTGHGRCYSLVPELFDSDEFGHGVVTVPEVAPALEEKARTAVGNCPEGCISLEP